MKAHNHILTIGTTIPGIKRCGWSGCAFAGPIERPALAVQGSETSSAAAARIEGSPRLMARASVLEAIRGNPEGLTDERGIEITGLDPSTYRPRRVELVQSGGVYDSGKTRMTKSGREAVVWRAR